jgi:hypothetical protein
MLMGRINYGKVVTGGLVAGIVMNVLDFVMNDFLMKSQFEAVSVARNIDPGAAAAAIPAFVVIDLALGLLAVFTYAAIRPRFRPGPNTAVIAGAILGVTGSLVAAFFAASGFFPWGVWTMASAISLVNICLATMAGAALYSE